jgi:hypothetical protein
MTSTESAQAGLGVGLVVAVVLVAGIVAGQQKLRKLRSLNWSEIVFPTIDY